MRADLETLEAALGYRFTNRKLLERAITHKSRAYEKNLHHVLDDNEQLEFLGDSILGFVVSDLLVATHPEFPEGRLSKLKAHLVSASHLYEVAQRLELGEYLLLGKGEELSGGREKRALLSDAVEAIMAAIYLDGGIDVVRAFIIDAVIAGFTPPDDQTEKLLDYKSALQELAQSMKLPQPRYSIVDERGPEHAKTFLVEVRVGREWVGRAEGLSKKSAGQNAAKQVLQLLSQSTG
jgi:ribonuclease-3